MFLKINKPITPSQRHAVKAVKNHLEKTPKLKSKIKGIKIQAGRSRHGKITIKHKGGGHKKRYRIIDLKRHTETEGIVLSIEYDPNRSSYISAIYETKNNAFFYITTPLNLNIGDIVKSGRGIDPKIGYSMPLSEIPAGSYIHNVSIVESKKAVFSRSAGSSAILLEKLHKKAKIKLNSGTVKWVSNQCFSTVGLVSNGLMFLTKKGKAGNSRWLNVRPTVRGVAMNPVDHPNGGGEGKKSGMRKNPWGKKRAEKK